MVRAGRVSDLSTRKLVTSCTKVPHLWGLPWVFKENSATWQEPTQLPNGNYPKSGLCDIQSTRSNCQPRLGSPASRPPNVLSTALACQLSCHAESSFDKTPDVRCSCGRRVLGTRCHNPSPFRVGRYYGSNLTGSTLVRTTLGNTPH